MLSLAGQVVNHNPICRCPPSFEGDPFVHCSKIRKPPRPPRDPCVPHPPCGPYSNCHPVNDRAVCSCQEGYFGYPPNCRPECVVDSDCRSNRHRCVQEKCVDPCDGACGANARCDVIDRNVICSCLPGHTGDPFRGCTVEEEPVRPCHPNPCGSNAVCKAHRNAGSCVCLPDYFGDPYVACKPECVTNSDCYGRGRQQACIDQKCRDPCRGNDVCGINAVCNVINQEPICSCLTYYTGNPSHECHLPPSKI